MVLADVQCEAIGADSPAELQMTQTLLPLSAKIHAVLYDAAGLRLYGVGEPKGPDLSGVPAGNGPDRVGCMEQFVVASSAASLMGRAAGVA